MAIYFLLVLVRDKKSRFYVEMRKANFLGCYLGSPFSYVCRLKAQRVWASPLAIRLEQLALDVGPKIRLSFSLPLYTLVILFINGVFVHVRSSNQGTGYYSLCSIKYNCHTTCATLNHNIFLNLL